jgi:trans-aconitate 2-methyltransferase
MPWNPSHYLRFADERLRPFVDLLARCGAEMPRRVVDLGCGPGNATVLLAERWPDADVVGVDGSEEMIAAAQRRASSSLSFRVGDVLDFGGADDRGTDVVFSNATFQWVPGHLARFGAYIESLVPGGWFCFQVPAMAEAPSHSAIASLAIDTRWADRLAPLTRQNAIESADTYLETLIGLGCQVDCWDTTYVHLLQGDDAVLNWVSSTSLRPYVQALDGDERAAFLEEIRIELAELYPKRSFGTPYRFHRRFVVAQRIGDPGTI